MRGTVEMVCRVVEGRRSLEGWAGLLLVSEAGGSRFGRCQGCRCSLVTLAESSDCWKRL